MKNRLTLVWLTSLVCVRFATTAFGFDPVLPRVAASNTPTLYLDAAARRQTVDLFEKLVTIKGSSGHEEAVRVAVMTELKRIGAVELTLKPEVAGLPLNLAMELPATGGLTNRPGILLNAHLDTVDWSNPERMDFEPATGDYFHQDERESGKRSSFGGDDRSGVAVIVAALQNLHRTAWQQGLPHRRLVLVFTAGEERGCLGAKALAKDQAELFTGIEVALSIDGPLDLQSGYPKDSFVTVVSAADAVVAPYDQVLRRVAAYCQKAGRQFGRTEVGLGMGDFAYFPAAAHAGLHLRSVVRGWHTKERVQVGDLVRQTDLICSLLLDWDEAGKSDRTR